MYGSIGHDEIIRAFIMNVPDCYVRDYRSKSGWLAICKGYKEIVDNSTGHVWTVPAIQLAVVPRGNVTAATLVNGSETVRPGWRLEMKKARQYLTPAQMDRIERALHARVFQRS